MAKGNLFQGMARGKVGDVVFYRMNGVQMTRVRNRAPKNPRTNEQLYQRAVIASVMKLYSLGKSIFDHSFQSYTIGEGCMRRFNSVNTRILRSQLINDLNENVPVQNQMARFCAPSSLTPTPMIGMQVSEGTADQNLFIPIESGGVYDFMLAPATGDNVNVNEYLRSLGISAGDIFTFVVIAANKAEKVYTNPWTNSEYANQYETTFGWWRLIVKDNIPDTAEFGTATLFTLFQIESEGQPIKLNFEGGNLAPGKKIGLSADLADYGAVAAVIRSRNDVDLRSTSYTVPIVSKSFGISSSYVLTVWQNMVQKVGQSELILEGGDGPALQPMSTGAVAKTQVVNSPVIETPSGTARHRGTNNNPK